MKKATKISSIIAISVAVVLAVGGGIWYYLHKKSNSEQNNATATDSTVVEIQKQVPEYELAFERIFKKWEKAVKSEMKDLEEPLVYNAYGLTEDGTQRIYYSKLEFQGFEQPLFVVSQKFQDVYYVVDIFHFNGTEYVRLFDEEPMGFWERNYCFLTQSGKFITVGINSATDSQTTVWEMNPKTKLMHEEKIISTELKEGKSDETENIGFFESKGEHLEMSEISEEIYSEQIEKLLDPTTYVSVDNYKWELLGEFKQANSNE